MLEGLVGKTVEVITFETVYRGTLIEIGEQEVHIQSEYEWIVVPVNKITDIKEAD